jgi:hypothetical protein
MKTINVEDETWRNLNTTKYSMGCSTMDELINKLIQGYNPTEEQDDGEDDSGDTEDTV